MLSGVIMFVLSFFHLFSSRFCLYFFNVLVSVALLLSVGGILGFFRVIL